VYHVGNRGSRKGPLFDTWTDYDAFENLVASAREIYSTRITAYCLMENHFHFLVWPHHDDELSQFMHWLTGEHAKRRRRDTDTVGEGAVYQGRFWAFPIFDELHLLAATRYIERNPVEARIVHRAERWTWSSASRFGPAPGGLPVDPGPCPLPADWLEIVNCRYYEPFIDYV
jgi:putative transposase